eukprot:CAMPEP_0194215416 /NCGR_PEP_ID=MMETSP0156-20130528/17208_1 /TAXON_ID=33649 /ORGANISM="Thalassionema nitzschioides, Strain L26-B" /LENGTH=340 /DNA_ID=CAMNT_0038943919 /DNA_START=188 /DNA_END=1207 /DNA_ORIENTATION=-
MVSSPSLKYVQGLRSVFPQQDHPKIVLLDMWGVMHNGSKPYDGVLETIQSLKKLDNVRLVILSNSSKRQSHSIKMLKKLGFNPSDFDDIITSGEVSYRMLSGDTTLECGIWSAIEEINSSANKDKKVFVYGSGDGDETYCESAGWKLASVSDANLIVARGTFTINDGAQIVSKKENKHEYDEVFEKSLAAAAERKIPMLVCNPDKVRPDKGLPPMPGAIGDMYAELLKDSGFESPDNLIKRIGKPFQEVYDLALKDEDPSLAIMIGDALETDVTGGNNIGCTTLWVINDGIHSPAVVEKGDGDYESGVSAVLDYFNEVKKETTGNSLTASPTFVVPHFRW